MALHTIVEHDSTHIKPYIDAKIGNFTGHITDNEPYVLRQGLGNLADMDLVGGSLAWNQFCEILTTQTINGVTFTSDGNGSYTLSGSTSANTANKSSMSSVKTVGHNHKIFYGGAPKNNKGIQVILGLYLDGAWKAQIGTATASIYDLGSNYNGVALSMWVPASTQTAGEKFTPQLIDLTQLFGTTIADYIYSLELATAGAGVAWFRKYFSNVYYGHQSGKIENVNVASRKVVGKNLLPFTINTQTYKGITCVNNGNGTYTLSGASTGNADFVLVGTSFGSEQVVFPKGTYTMTNDNSNSNIELHIGYGSTTYISGQTLLPVNATNGIAWIIMRVKNGTTVNNITVKPMLRLATVEDDTFEPYQSSIYAFDSSKQLRGIPKLVDNKLSYDGDIYTADGSVTRKYGIVDLGTLNWTYQSDLQRFISNGLQNVIKADNNSFKANIITSKYLTIEANNCNSSHNKTCAATANKNIIICDLSYSDATLFKSALDGVYLVYELATPTTESANAYQNPQRAFTDGTEEFIDAGVQSATRDVSIPVGNNTTYQLNETLPPIEDYVDGALKIKAAISALGTDESGRTTASRAYTTGEFFYKDGKMYKVLTSIAQGATFTINTNCQQTTLFAELKALAQ